MKTGRIEDNYLTKLSLKGNYYAGFFSNCFYSLFSFLRGLVPIFNSVAANDLIDPLRAKADGTTEVIMKHEFSRVGLQVTSQV